MEAGRGEDSAEQREYQEHIAERQTLGSRPILLAKHQVGPLEAGGKGEGRRQSHAGACLGRPAQGSRHGNHEGRGEDDAGHQQNYMREDWRDQGPESPEAREGVGIEPMEVSDVPRIGMVHGGGHLRLEKLRQKSGHGDGSEQDDAERDQIAG